MNNSIQSLLDVPGAEVSWTDAAGAASRPLLLDAGALFSRAAAGWEEPASPWHGHFGPGTPRPSKSIYSC